MQTKNGPLYEMARIGEFAGFFVYVYGSEGPVPHFHVLLGKPEAPSWESCIRIQGARYFQHGRKQETLNAKQKRQLVDFLRAPHKHFPDRQNWQILIIQWSMNNPDHEIDPNLLMPDYTQLR